MFKRRQSKDNLLDYIPVRSNTLRWETNANGHIVLLIDRNGWLDRTIRWFKKTPEVMRIELDAYGSFVWQTIDGTRNIEQICSHLKTTFGNDVEPLYQRFSSYIKILKNNDFITLSKPQ